MKKEDNKTSPVYIYIDVKGQVENPGVYKLLADSRLFQLITLERCQSLLNI